MISPLSQLSQSFRDTLVHRCESLQLAKLSDMFGAPWPQPWDENDWRGALTSAAYSVRGSHGMVRTFLQHALKKHLRKVRIKRTDGALPNWIESYYVSGDADYQDVFTSDDYSKWILLPYYTWKDPLTKTQIQRTYRVYSIIGPGDVTSIPFGKANGDPGYMGSLPANSITEWAELCPVKTAYWDAANWGECLVPADIGLPDWEDAYVMPFSFCEPTPGPKRGSVNALQVTGLLPGYNPDYTSTSSGREDIACKVILDVYATTELALPPTYLVDYFLPVDVNTGALPLEDNALNPSGIAREAGQPDGGIIVENETIDTTGNYVGGVLPRTTRPIYLTGGNVLGSFGDVVELLLASGVEAVVRSTDALKGIGV